MIAITPLYEDGLGRLFFVYAVLLDVRCCFRAAFLYNKVVSILFL